jgi:hypothetical protein
VLMRTVATHMKKSILTILTLVLSLTLNAQDVDLGEFPSQNIGNEPVLTSELLESLGWENLKSFSNSNEGHYANEREDSLLMEYEYVQQGRVADFVLTSYKGKVMEFRSQISNASRETNTYYFDKIVWLEYAHDYLPNLPDSLKLTINEPRDVLKAYYELIGVGTRDEYGWICEYSTVGMATQRRQATIQLIRYNKRKLLESLLNYPNIQVNLYAIDALIYDDFMNEEYIKEHLALELTRMKKELDSLNALNITDWRIESLNHRITDNQEYTEELKSKLLGESDWKRINAIRDCNQEVKTCMSGTGSYKIYSNTTAKLLSESAIADIPKRYQELKELGYFR